MDSSQYIIRDRGILGGMPVFTGTRVPLRTVLASLAEGDDEAEILRSFPTLTREHVRAAIAFAAAAAVEDMPSTTEHNAALIRAHSRTAGT
jgi:uncharacterized protein (DUF433 family)